MPYTQSSRVCSFDPPPGFGADDLLLRRFEGTEWISRPFHFVLELRSEKPDIDFKQMVGKKVAWHVALERGGKRHFSGFVARFEQRGSDDELTTYVAEVVPWLALLEKRSNLRIFQNLNTWQIAQKIFSEAGFSDFEAKLGGLQAREYCVQYRESDLAFVSRLLEEEGITWWFRHEEKKHVLVLADSTKTRTAKLSEPLEYVGLTDRTAERGWVETWQAEREVQTAKWTVGDWNFETPTTSLELEMSSPAGNSHAHYDYPTRHADRTQGEARARLRIEIEEAAAERFAGTSAATDLCPGVRFALSGHARGSFNGEYLITRVTHRASQALERGQAEPSEYANSFSCIPAAKPYRAPLATPKPIVQGVQTALVVGKAGEELDVDKYGRVKVQFHWDREGKKDENSSCWVRVAQSHASGGFGGAFWPRIGDEVVVSFLHGDPDQPLIVGRVYNAQSQVPYELPARVTQSAIKTRSTKGGSASTFNEIRFEDKKGEEHVFIHAEKDRHERTKNDLHQLVEGEHHLTVKKDEVTLHEGKRHAEVKGELVEKVGGAQEVEVGQDRKEKIGMSHHVSVGMNRHAKVGQNEAVDAGMQIHLKAGMTVVIEAGVQLTLKAGAGFVTIGADGVSISGPMVKINSGGAAGAGSGAQPQAPKAPAAPKEGLKE